MYVHKRLILTLSVCLPRVPRPPGGRRVARKLLHKLRCPARSRLRRHHLSRRLLFLMELAVCKLAFRLPDNLQDMGCILLDTHTKARQHLRLQR